MKAINSLALMRFTREVGEVEPAHAWAFVCAQFDAKGETLRIELHREFDNQFDLIHSKRKSILPLVEKHFGIVEGVEFWCAGRGFLWEAPRAKAEPALRPWAPGDLAVTCVGAGPPGLYGIVAQVDNIQAQLIGSKVAGWWLFEHLRRPTPQEVAAFIAAIQAKPEPPAPDKRCGTCRHWTQYGKTGKGGCGCPLPSLPFCIAEIQERFVNDFDGANCPCWDAKA